MTDNLIPKGKYAGRALDSLADEERHHFTQCPGCGQWLDMRDLGQVFEHVGELPHVWSDENASTT
jgi:hypothetical protein